MRDLSRYANRARVFACAFGVGSGQPSARQCDKSETPVASARRPKQKQLIVCIMEIIFLSIGVIADSVAIILLWVSHVRGNRKRKSVITKDDLRRADALQRYYEMVVNSPNPFERLFTKVQDHD